MVTETVVITPVGDSAVQESQPDANYGDSTRLRVDGGSQPDIESYLMFQVSDISNDVVEAKLRLMPTTGSNGGLAVYSADSAWSEMDITWANRPTRFGDVLDELDEVTADEWIEFDVSEAVTGNGVYTFVIVSNSADGANMSSKQGADDPELVLTMADPDATPTTTATATATERSNPTATPTSGPDEPTSTPSPESPTKTPVPTNTPTPEPTSTPASPPAPSATPEPLSTIDSSAIIISPAADSRVDQAEPDLNRGTGKQLRVDGDDGLTVETYLVFRVRGISGTVTNATLRVYSLMDSTQGPAVYAASSDWTEGQITWANRPARTSEVLDRVGVVVAESWIEFDVTAVVTEEGVYTFMLATESTDGMNMASRESSENQPYLAVTVADPNTLSADSALPTVIATWTPSADSAAIRPRDLSHD